MSFLGIFWGEMVGEQIPLVKKQERRQTGIWRQRRKRGRANGREWREGEKTKDRTMERYKGRREKGK